MRREVWASALGWVERDEDEILIGGIDNRLVSLLDSSGLGSKLRDAESNYARIQYPRVPSSTVHQLFLWPGAMSQLDQLFCELVSSA